MSYPSRMTESKKHVPGGYRDVLAIAWPLIISTGSFTVMQFVDRIFLARYSPLSIQAALPAGILSFTMICGFMAIAGYANTLVAQYHGAGNPHACARSTAQAFWFSLMTWPLLLLLIPVGNWLLTSAGHPPAVLAEERQYFSILLGGGGLVVLNSAISSFFTGRGETFLNMVAVVAGNVVNIVLDYALIFGNFGLPEMGIRGAAWATNIAGLVTPLILFVLYLTERYHTVYATRRHWRFESDLFLRLLRFGVPAGIHFLLDIASFTVFVLLVGRMGELSLAVSNIALSINMVAFMPMVGISIATATLVGQYQGMKDSTTAAKSGWTALRIACLYMVLIGITYILLPRAYFSLFAPAEGSGWTLDQLVDHGRWLLWMMAAWGLFDAANLVLSGALKGAGDTRFVMWYSVLMGWLVLVPVITVLVLFFGAGLFVAWGVLTAYVMVLAIGYWWRFAGGSWKSIAVIEATPAAPPVRATEDFVAAE